MKPQYNHIPANLAQQLANLPPIPVGRGRGRGRGHPFLAPAPISC